MKSSGSFNLSVLEEVEKLVQTLEALQGGEIVAIATQDYAGGVIDVKVKNACAFIGATMVGNLAYGGNFAIVGQHSADASSNCQLRFGDRKLTFGDRQLTFGDCQLTFGNCQLTFSDCQLTFGDRKLTLDNRKLTFDDCQLTFSDRKLTFSDRKLTFDDCQLTLGDRKLIFDDCQLTFDDCQLTSSNNFSFLRLNLLK
jgi:hypothetical protein